MAKDAPVPLARYNAKRDFGATPEPEGRPARKSRAKALAFVIQKHWASHLHYDFRLELGGVMLSWAVPKGPSFDPAVKAMAIHVEDHPVSYNAFEGTIPKGHYGAGTVIIWDRGTWAPVGDPKEGLAKGKLIFQLHGQKLAGLWELVRISKPGQFKQDHWLLLKKRGDVWARPSAAYDVITALPDSVVEKPLGLAEDRAQAADTPDLSRAVRAALPATLKPQLATLAAAAPPGDWVVENKFDGYRLLARVSAGKARLFTRQGNDWTARLRPIAQALQAMKLGSGWFDGEIAVLNAQGVPDFNRLQNAIDNDRAQDIVFFLFDLPFHQGRDLRAVPLKSRRAALQQLLDGQPTERIRFSDTLPAAPGDVLAAACRLGLEGVMLKRADAPYVSRRSDDWLKLKCQRRQEFVVIGFTDRTNSPGEVGALMLGYHEDGRLRSAGSVGTGWGTAQGRELHRQLVALETKQPTIAPEAVAPGRWSKRARGSERWVKPKLVVEVAFGEWTPDGHIRHASFRGVREDKPAQAITREQPHMVEPSPPTTQAERRHVITHPDRVIDPSTGLRKIDLVHYYESVADWLLPHLRQRPVSLVRAPQGITGQLFFQKHSEAKMPGVVDLDADLWPEHAPLLEIHTLEGLISATQMNVIEFHTWNSTVKKIDQPDRVVFDLDPGEGITWPQLREAALLMHTMLDELGLKSWLKTSGGKGLHVVVPLAPKLDADAVKAFSKAVVAHMAQTIPQRFVAKSGGARRVGRIFIDYLRNGHGQTTAAAFSARARPGMGVSMPVAWEQLAELKSGAHWTVKTAREYLSFAGTDPWAAYRRSRQTLATALRRLQLT